MITRTAYHVQLEALTTHVGRLGDLAAANVRASALAVAGDMGAAAGVEKDVQSSARLREAIERSCLEAMLLQQPVAGELRLVSSAFRVVSDLARVCEMCRGVAALSEELYEEHDAADMPAELVDLIGRMSRHAANMVERAVVAYIAADEPSAKAVAADDANVDELYARVRDVAVENFKSGTNDPACVFTLAAIAKYYERMGDRAQRVCDWAIFRQTGQAHATLPA